MGMKNGSGAVSNEMNSKKRESVKRAVISENKTVLTDETNDVTKYFAFLFSNWAQVRQGNPEKSPKDIQEIIWQHWNITRGQTLGNSAENKKTKKVRDPQLPKK